MTTSDMHVALTLGRHEIKTNDGVTVTKSIFQQDVPDLLDFAAHEKVVNDWLNKNGLARKYPLSNTTFLYLTGATMLTTAFLKAWVMRPWSADHVLYLMHYDRDSGLYRGQRWF